MMGVIVSVIIISLSHSHAVTQLSLFIMIDMQTYLKIHNEEGSVIGNYTMSSGVISHFAWEGRRSLYFSVRSRSIFTDNQYIWLSSSNILINYNDWYKKNV